MLKICMKIYFIVKKTLCHSLKNDCLQCLELETLFLTSDDL